LAKEDGSTLSGMMGQ